MRAALLNALKGICTAVGTEPDTTARILAAAKGPAPIKEKLLRTREAAALLDCHAKSVHRYAARGLLHPIRRSPRAIRWRRSEVERLALEGAAQ